VSFELAPEWVHVQYAEQAQFTEIYGFGGTQGAVNCEGVRFVPKGKPSKTLAVFMHPSSTRFSTSRRPNRRPSGTRPPATR
jgi:hypothetical protein